MAPPPLQAFFTNSVLGLRQDSDVFDCFRKSSEHTKHAYINKSNVKYLYAINSTIARNDNKESIVLMMMMVVWFGMWTGKCDGWRWWQNERDVQMMWSSQLMMKWNWGCACPRTTCAGGSKEQITEMMFNWTFDNQIWPLQNTFEQASLKASLSRSDIVPEM